MNHRFFVPDGLEPGTTIDLPEDERHHARVLRVREGEEVEVFDAKGRNFTARFAEGRIAVLRETGNREPATSIALAMSIIQLDKLELVLQKGTELGVSAFIPLITDRMEVRIERVRGKEERWEKIVLEAVKQSGRSRIPELVPPVRFDEAIARDGANVVLDTEGQPPATGNRQPTTLFVGPEGGFSERELDLARQRGAVFCSLGPRRLRAETAAIAAAVLFTR